MHYKKLVNFALFVIGWWTALLYGNAMALIALFLVLMLHFLMWRDIQDIFVVLGFIFCGFGVEWAFMASGVLDYGSNLPPAWSICIWAMLSITVRHSLAWLVGAPLWCVLAGLLLAPAFYANSIYFGPANWGLPTWQCLLVISLVWGLFAACVSRIMLTLMRTMEPVRNEV
ncbi:DUF2878 domain-containing protein [Microbulbifer sp. HZ11]|uniref:DUF2878 domain-containing protein n=1 Tax=unclassified Microbulbifer TaxID=2619833 RepID=UPI0005BA18E5|nr:DUF2878 domain-containing protein [Microbulbifer sp. HZ11]